MHNCQGKKLLVLGGASQHCKVVEAAHRLGAKVYVADYLKDSPAKLIADDSFLIDIFATEKLVELCRKESIDGVVATSLDACQLPYQKVCEEMNYPCFGTAEQYRILTDKEKFKQCCQKYGVDTIPSYTEMDLYDNKEIEYPVFIKPVDSRGSRGQYICTDRDSAIAAVKQAKKESISGNVLIEKYMQGYPDFTVSYLVKDGEPILVRTGDRFEGPIGSGIENLCIASCSPSKYTDIYLNSAHKNVISMLKGINLRNAPVFFQGFIEKDKVRFYDPGLRFAGGEYERLQYIATGKDIIEMLVEYALSGQQSDQVIDHSISKLNGKYLVQLDPTIREGRIKEIEGIESIQRNPAVIYISQRYKVGDEVLEGNDLRRRFAEFAVLSDSIEDEIKTIQYIQEELRVIDTNGQDMIIYPFDIKNLKNNSL